MKQTFHQKFAPIDSKIKWVIQLIINLNVLSNLKAHNLTFIFSYLKLKTTECYRRAKDRRALLNMLLHVCSSQHALLSVRDSFWVSFQTCNIKSDTYTNVKLQYCCYSLHSLVLYKHILNVHKPSYDSKIAFQT